MAANSYCYLDVNGTTYIIGSGGTLQSQSGSTASFAGTTTFTGTQTFTGTTSLTMPLFDVGSPAAAGSTQADGTNLSKMTNFVTAADATKGVILPAAVAGKLVYVRNTAASALKVYGAAGAQQINGVAGDTAYSIAANGGALFFCESATDWYTLKSA